MRCRAAGFAAALVAIPTVARADASGPEAKAAHDAARVLFDDGDFDGAYVKFLAAYEASHDPRRLWDMALAEKGLRHYAAALRLIARYASEGGARLSRDEVRRATALSASIEPFTASVVLHVTEPGADVVLDDERLGASPLASPVVVDLGVRRLRVTKAGFRPYAASVPIGGRTSVAVDVALVREAGHLTVVAPGGAEIAIDGAHAGVGTIDVDLASGGHMIRVTAPGRRAFQTEVALGDHEARTLAVTLDPGGPNAARGPEVRVAVGCGSREPIAPEQGLRVYFDGGTASEALTGLRRRWDNERQAEVVDYAAYAIEPGGHDVTVRAPGCRSASARVDVAEDRPVTVVGALAPEEPFFARGPAGLANGWGIALAAWGGWTRYENFLNPLGVNLTSTIPFGGVALSAENADRFFVFAVDTRFGYARPDETTTPNQATSISKASAGVRFGPRLPLDAVALAGGAAIGGYIDVMSPADAAPKVSPGTYASWWAGLSVASGCDWSGEALFARGLVSGGDAQTSDLSLSVGVRFRPGAVCRAARGVEWGLRAQP
jgi:hypothetical protein